jgi:hypothetical protein
MVDGPRTEPTDDLNELRARIAAIETGTQPLTSLPNHDERATGRSDLRRGSSLRRSALQRKTPLRRNRETN